MYGAMDYSAFEKHYKAFISYSHGDNREQGRKWADWLHHSLETYVVPAELAGQTNQYGKPIPAQIFPVFQDEKELSARANLGAALQEALDHAEFLVLLASPRSARSRYVQEEIRHFKRTGKGDRIIALILRGEPEYGETQSEAQCFPEVLRFAVDHDGRIRHDQPEEALAADVRLPHSRDEGYTAIEAYRRYLQRERLPPTQIREKTAAYQARLELAKLKIIATILGVPLAELTKRDQAYQLEKIRRKNRNIQRVSAAIALLAIVASASGVYAWQQKNEAQTHLAQSLYMTGINKLSQQDFGEPAAYIAAAVRGGSGNAAQFAESMLALHDDRMLLPDMSAAFAAFSPDGRYLAGFADQGDGQFVLQWWDAAARRLLAEMDDSHTAHAGKPLFDADNRVYVQRAAGEIVRHDPVRGSSEVRFHETFAGKVHLDAVSPDSRWLLLYDYAAGEWVLADMERRMPLRRFAQGTNTLRHAAFSADSGMLLLWHKSETGSGGEIVHLADGRVLPFTGGRDAHRVRFAADGRQILLGSGHDLTLVDADSGDVLPLASDGDSYAWADFNDDGETVMALGNDGYTVFRRHDGTRKAKHLLPLSALYRLLPENAEHSPDETRTIGFFNRRSYLQTLGNPPLLVDEFVFALDVPQIVADDSGQYLFVLSPNRQGIARLDSTTRQRQENFVHLPEEAAYIQIVGGKWLMAVTAEKTLYFYDAGSGKAVGEAMPTQARAIRINRSGDRIFVRTAENRVAIRNIEGGSEVWHHQSSEESAGFAMDHDFRYLLVGAAQGWQLQDVDSGTMLLSGEEALTHIAFSPDGRWLALAQAEGRTDVYRLPECRLHFSLPTVANPLLQFSPDGKVLLAAQDTKRLRLWDTASGKAYGQSIAVMPDSKLLAFTTDSRRLFVQDYSEGKLVPTIKIIDSASGNPVALPFATGIYGSAQLVADDTRLVTVDTSGEGRTVQIWQVPGGQEMPPAQLADELESFYGRRYDAATGTVDIHSAQGNGSSWYVQDVLTRPVAPGAQTTVVQVIERLVPVRDTESLRLLSSAHYYHPLARAALGEYFSRAPDASALARHFARIARLQLAQLDHPELQRKTGALLERYSPVSTLSQKP